MSSILSASSRTRYLTFAKLTFPFSTKSNNLPGVAIKILQPKINNEDVIEINIFFLIHVTETFGGNNKITEKAHLSN